MRLLISGSEGFLGKAVCSAATAAGHEVRGLDIVNGMDITKPMAISILADGPGHAQFDAVVHMAAIAAPKTCDADPTLAYDVNVNGCHQVLKLAVAAGAKKFVFISSAHVYGISPKYMPTDEQHPLHPQETYTTTKILGEKLCELYHENYGLSYTTLRLFNAYGPGQLPGYFIPDQILKAQKGDIQLGGSNVTKDWVYIDDVVDAVLKALESDFVGPVNVGTGVETDLESVASIIAKVYKVELDPIPIDNPTRMLCDWSRAKSILGWSPSVDLQEGLRRIIESSVRTIS